MNAKTEFLEHIRNRKVICAKIWVDRYDFECKFREEKWFILKNDYSEADFDSFCNSLDFEYDNGYGSQELFGMILFEDSYSDRGEYDGSEWWENHKMPTIESVLRFNNK